jgi:hypothetical protein
VAARARRARLRRTSRAASSAAPAEPLRRKRLQRSSNLLLGQSAQLLAKRLRGGHDDGAQLRQRLSAGVDGAAARDQQQLQGRAPLARPRERERLAGERGPRGPGRVKGVVLAAEAALRAWRAADLDNRRRFVAATVTCGSPRGL